MQKKESSSLRYAYSYIGGKGNSFIFEGTTGVIYEVKFKHSPYLFDVSYAFSDHVYEFSIILLSVPEGRSPTSDPVIAPTIVAIFLDFYERVNDKSITVYICDSSDLKQHVRKRLFDWWYLDYNDGFFVKLDNYIKDLDGIKYPVSLLFRAENLFKDEIIDAFVKLIATQNHGK